MSEEKSVVRESVRRTQESKSGLGLGTILSIAAIFLMTAVLVAVIGFNALNIRNQYLTDLLKDVPFVNKLLPPLDENGEIKYENYTTEDFVAEVEKLNSQIVDFQMESADKDKTIMELKETVGDNADEIARLRAIEADQLRFKADKAEFDQLVALNDSEAYARFYESVSPENAAELYKQVVVNNSLKVEAKNYIATFKSMDNKSAAAMLEVLIPSDIDLVGMILKNLDADSRAAILSQMKPANAAVVAKIIAPPIT